MEAAGPNDLTRPEKWLRALLWGHALLSALFAIGYVVSADTTTLGFISNSLAKDGLFAVLSVIGAADVRRRGWLAPVLALAYVFLIAGHVVSLATGGAPGVDVLGLHVSSSLVFAGWIASDLGLAVWLTWWWLAAERARHGLRYLNPIAFHGLASVAEVLIEGAGERVAPEQIARNVDVYLSELKARAKAQVHLALTLLGLYPPLPLPLRSAAARERFLRRFLEDVRERRLLRPLRPYLQAFVRTAAQMSYLGYYGDRASYPSIGFVPFAERPGGRPPVESDHAYGRLRALAAPPRDRRWDVVVIGSGAAGGLLAYRFAEAGLAVLVLERGPYVDPRDFTDNEVRQYLRLYNEGALQLATHFELQVLQGMCVGGGTTINNGVCFDPPAHVLDAWSQRGIERAGLLRAIAEVRDWLTVRRISPQIVAEGARRFAQGAAAAGLPGRVELVETNMRATCLGTGYCNIGCAYGQRHAMLDMVLPAAQDGLAGSLDILPDFQALELARSGDRVTGVVGEHLGRTPATIEADQVVVAAGALGSSWLLQRSGIGGDRVGADLHFNINSPMVADFPDPVDSFAGIQMTHAYVPAGDEPPYVLETWFNTPATQALAMPGWFDAHYANMLRYRHMSSGGALVGTTRPGRAFTNRRGPQFAYEASPEDLARVVEGVKLIGRVFLAAGASRVMPATLAWREYRTSAEVDDLDSVVQAGADLLLTTAHPQGGNAVGEAGHGVVDPDFRVHGLRNLWLCDASVFPSSVTVNPQLTVMGMAQYAAPRMLAGF
ncbi:MAG: hypothetical protein QOF17_66 [Solirubrobacteraceae bacterium]|nr:hypothetical protein [Solirubrobacteraceae bacterium]